MNKAQLRSYSETLVEVSMAVQNKYDAIHNVIEDSREIVSLCISWTEEFEKLHKHTDWDKIDWLLTIDQFTGEKIQAVRDSIY